MLRLHRYSRRARLRYGSAETAVISSLALLHLKYAQHVLIQRATSSFTQRIIRNNDEDNSSFYRGSRKGSLFDYKHKRILIKISHCLDIFKVGVVI